MIRHARPLLLLPLSLALAACTSYVPVPYRPMAESGAAAGACGNLDADARYAPLRGRVALDNLAQQTDAMRNDARRPTRTERAALAEWRRESDGCRRATIAATREAGTPPAVLALDTRLADDLDALAGELAAGRIGYGDYARRRQSLTDGYNDAVARVAGSDEAARYGVAPPVYYYAPYAVAPPYYAPPPYYYQPWYPAIGGSVWYGSGWHGRHGRGGWGVGIGF